MNKFRQLVTIFSLMMAAMLMVSCTGIGARSLGTDQNTPDAIPVDYLNEQSNEPASCAASVINIETDASDELYTQYEAGSSIAFDYSVQSTLDADECAIICEGEGITLLYVEAVHNSIFGIESTAEVPDISETLIKIEDELGTDLNEDAGSSSARRDEEDLPAKIMGMVMWKDANGSEQPVKYVKVQIVDVEITTDLLGTHYKETILENTATDEDGEYKVEIPDCLYGRK